MIKNESRHKGVSIFARVSASYISLFSASYVTPTFTTVMEREASGNCLSERNEHRVFGKVQITGGEKKEEKTGSIVQVEQIKLAVKNNLQT